MIDASHILELMGEQATAANGKQTVDAETLRIVHQQIEELSNLGNHEKAQLLKEFVEAELKPAVYPQRHDLMKHSKIGRMAKESSDL